MWYIKMYMYNIIVTFSPFPFRIILNALFFQFFTWFGLGWLKLGSVGYVITHQYNLFHKILTVSASTIKDKKYYFGKQFFDHRMKLNGNEFFSIYEDMFITYIFIK